MYKITFCLLFVSVFGFSQNIQFDDPDLLSFLTNNLCVDTNGDGTFNATADFNNDGEIQFTEAQQVIRFKFNTLAHDIEDIGGFENFINLEYLDISTIDITHLDTSVWTSLQTLKLSTAIDSFVFDNPLLTDFYLQNVGFNNPVFDLTNLPSLEYVRVQSTHLTDNLIFGVHNNLEELRILDGTFSTLNLAGMPALKYATIADFIGTTLDISNNTVLEEFNFNYSENTTTLIGSDASPLLEIVDFDLDDTQNTISNLDITFNNQNLNDVSIRGAKSVSITNNVTTIGSLDLYFIQEAIAIDNCNFGYIDSSLNSSLDIIEGAVTNISLTNVAGIRFLTFQNITTTLPIDLTTLRTEHITLSSCNFTQLLLKNGDILQQFNSSSDTAIEYICIDTDELSIVENGYSNSSQPAVINSYCSFGLGGEYFEITGDVLIDLGAGCNVSNGPIFDLQFNVSDGTDTETFYTTNNNNYSYTLPEGTFELNTHLTNLDLWTVSPSTITLDFPTDVSPFVQDYCVTPSMAYNDAEITLVPLNDAQPGFETNYKLIYKNTGTTVLSGVIDIAFDDTVMEFEMAVPAITTQIEGNISWEYTNLLPFETREIDVTMLLNTPTDPDFPLNGDDELRYTATINPVNTDETPETNVFELDQTVVNSFDPNVKKCLQGKSITPEQVGEYVHYIIRFENNGTANATNIVVKDILDTTTLDVSTFVPIYASHNFTTRVLNGNEVEFIFENIELPFDDATNDGFVVFKIKTIPTLVLGDTFSNQAEIYFDYNFPIITNNETTVVEEDVIFSVSEAPLNSVSIYPNPTSSVLIIKSEITFSEILMYDLNGRLLKTEHLTTTTTQYQVDLTTLSTGIYFIEIQGENLKHRLKFIKE